jgi:hypothetical protein
MLLRKSIILTSVLYLWVSAAYSAECPKYSFKGNKYSAVRKTLLHHGWHAIKTGFDFDQNHEIVCGSSGACGVAFWKEYKMNTCMIDMQVDKRRDEWVIIWQDIN